MPTAKLKLAVAAIAAAGLFGISGVGPMTALGQKPTLPAETAGGGTRGLNLPVEGSAVAPPPLTLQGRLWGHLAVAIEDGDTAFPELDAKSLDDLMTKCPRLCGGKAVRGAPKEDSLRRLQTARLNVAVDDLRALVERFKAAQTNDISLLHSAADRAVVAAADLFSDPKDLRPWLEERVRVAKWHEKVVEAKWKQGVGSAEDWRAVRGVRLDAEIALLKLARPVAVEAPAARPGGAPPADPPGARPGGAPAAPPVAPPGASPGGAPRPGVKTNR